jgi:hypothetical protein
VFLIVGVGDQGVRLDVGEDPRVSAADHLGDPARVVQCRAVVAVDSLGRRQFVGIGVMRRHELDLAAIVHDIHRAPVREPWHGQSRDTPERLGVVH